MWGILEAILQTILEFSNFPSAGTTRKGASELDRKAQGFGRLILGLIGFAVFVGVVATFFFR
ncbi:MAG: hypothetical protein QM796_04775 [Chthoniobacteraceae bacterium]